MTVSGPLSGVKVLEFAGIGPAPFAAMMLSDMGADVIRIERPGAKDPTPDRIDLRGRRTITLDLKDAVAVALCLELCTSAEIVIEGGRPGVMERLGLGPEVMLVRNPKLVYGRMTGWGQFGPLNQAAGHDINYIALTGALHSFGTTDKPVPPLNLVGDYGGGAMFLISGLLAGLIHARSTGLGQVVDAAMTDGTAYLLTLCYSLLAGKRWVDQRGINLLDGGAPFYDTYQCSDGHWISVGSIEPQFYSLLLEKSGATELMSQPQMERSAWPEMKQTFAAIFRTKTRDEWCALMEGTDVCFAPVLSLREAPHHPHNIARQTFIELDGVTTPAPAPRFSATPSTIRIGPCTAGQGARETLRDWGISTPWIEELVSGGILS
ncbi:CaiB/BaiF CoA transferase family protein [Paraburkholderia elongata]|uniref:CoA transferase n=1 Tax=Paraburkholderia elongata TaxID=2675747 RepID=A0A972NRL2_9BURK|nr:CaiB/BaiF CoA-transferase family protein [Paraburkholderia elongata]NPT57143.1 CoA transferase [Paraburkholderia elongata]